MTQVSTLQPPPILVVNDLNAVFTDSGNGGSAASAVTAAAA